MSNDTKDPIDIDFATAVAASAYAITLLEELSQSKKTEELTKPATRIKSKRGDSMNKPIDSSRISRWLTGKEATDERKSGSSRVETGLNQTSRKEQPSIKPTASFSGKGNGSRRTDSTRVKTKSDAWESAKLDRIRERYEKTKSTIQKWENEKKLKAKRRLTRKERDLDRMRAKASTEYQDKISRVEKVAAEARDIAAERRRNDEMVVKEKARSMRSTGEVPRTCFCF
ncbi:remorin-like [Canna indica]|uniref:Remorin-like n=1 Tax=Canna indica TaxID=4628 RepID=A0AAQ3KM33_9LILI|nr:remorin-like [Canna indica]